PHKAEAAVSVARGQRRQCGGRGALTAWKARCGPSAPGREWRGGSPAAKGYGLQPLCPWSEIPTPCPSRASAAGPFYPALKGKPINAPLRARRAALHPHKAEAAGGAARGQRRRFGGRGRLPRGKLAADIAKKVSGKQGARFFQIDDYLSSAV